MDNMFSKNEGLVGMWDFLLDSGDGGVVDMAVSILFPMEICLEQSHPRTVS